jgi:hypothetical protein
MRVGIRVMVCVGAVVVSVSGACAQGASHEVDLPTGDVWISQPQYPPQRGLCAAHEIEAPVKRPIPDSAARDAVNGVPAEFNFNLTLTLQHDDKQSKMRHKVSRRSPGYACGSVCCQHGGRPAQYRHGPIIRRGTP